VVANGVVMPWVFVHWTTEHGRRFVPVTVNVALAAPAVAPAGDIVAMVGAGEEVDEIAKERAFEKAPKLLTSIFTEPTETTSAGGMTAVSCVGLTYVVARVEIAGIPDGVGEGITQLTTEPFTKFVPVTVRVTGEVPQDAVEFDDEPEADKEATAGGEIVNNWDAGQFAIAIGADGVMS